PAPPAPGRRSHRLVYRWRGRGPGPCWHDFRRSPAAALAEEARSPAADSADRPRARAARRRRAPRWTATGRRRDPGRRAARCARGGTVRLRALSYNIHKCIGGVDRRYDPTRIVEVIHKLDVDVAMLQEVDGGVARSNRD